MSEPKYTSPHRIQVHRGFLKIPGSKALGTEDLIVREQTAAVYLEFYDLWRQAMSYLEPQATFAQMWLEHGTFRELMTQALLALGIERPLDLKLTQLAELLVHCDLDDGQLPCGMLFKLHGDFPKLQRMEARAPTTQKTNPQNKRSRIRFGTFVRLSSGIRAFWAALRHEGS